MQKQFFGFLNFLYPDTKDPNFTNKRYMLKNTDPISIIPIPKCSK